MSTALDLFGADTLPAAPPRRIDWPYITPGSLLRRRDVHIGAVWNYGVKYDERFVLHIDKDRSTGRIEPKYEHPDVFAAGREVLIDQIAAGLGTPAQELYQRALQLHQNTPAFGLLSLGEDWNCEDVARFVATGEKRSKQADEAVPLLAGAAIVGALIYFGKNA